MKRQILAILMAVILPIMLLTGCSGAPLSKSEYKKQSAKLIDGFLCATIGSDDLMEELSDLDMREFDRDTLADAKKVYEKAVKNGDEYLIKLEKLKAPEEMSGFHEDLLSCIEKVRDYEEKFLAAFDSKSEEKFENAMEKASSSMEKLQSKIEKLLKNEDWLLEELEDGEFMESGFMSGMVTKSRVTSADQTAKSIVDTVTNWIVDLEANGGKIPSDEVTIIIAGRSENGTWVGNVSAPGFGARIGDYSDKNYSEEKAVEKLKNYLAENFNFNKDITAIAVVKGRKVRGCAYCEEAVDAYTLANTFTLDTFISGYYEWNGKTDGIVGNVPGLSKKLIGTYPKLMMANGY